MAGRRISGRTVGKHTSQGQDMLATGTAKLHEGERCYQGPRGMCLVREPGAWWAFSCHFDAAAD